MIREVALVGFVQALFFCVIVLSKKKKKIHDYLLSSYFVLIACELIYRYLLSLDNFEANKALILFDVIYWALFGPVLYLYVKSVISADFKLRFIHSLHLLPLLISVFGFSTYLISENISGIHQFLQQADGLSYLAILLWEFCSAVYLLVIIYLLFKHKKSIKYFYSNNKHDLKWLLLLVLGFSLYIYSSYLYWLLIIFFEINSVFQFVDLLAIILCIYVFILGNFGYKQDGVFFTLNIIKEGEVKNEASVTNTRVRYAKARMDDVEINSLVYKIEDIMQSEKPYLQNDFSLAEFAQLLDTSLHKLSQTINLYYKKNFFEFINEYRVNEFKKRVRMKEYIDLKIEAIAYDCGFNSKSAFYSIFKRFENITPSQYKNNLT